VGNLVKLLLPNEPDYIATYGKINTYITGQIKSTSDVLFPYIETIKTDYNGTSVNSSFKILEREEYINTPESTLDQKKGDSESQTIFEYAMMKYYDRYIKGTLNNAYFSVLTFSDGTIHSAIFCPIQGGKICILDSAGDYTTSIQATTTPKIAVVDLGSYYNYWALKDKLLLTLLSTTSIQPMVATVQRSLAHLTT
jgi:hypothetical protein